MNDQLQFIVFPNTGIQICRNFPIRRNMEIEPLELWELANEKAKCTKPDEILDLITNHIAVNRDLEATAWFRPDNNELVFFRMTKISEQYYLDLVIDTHNGAGIQIKNKIVCVVKKSSFLRKKEYILGNFFVEEYRNFSRGSLLIDFGNSGTSVLFSPSGEGPLREKIITIDSPFDPNYKTRKPHERNILKSGITVLRVTQNPEIEPWVVLGKRAEELIQQEPYATYVYAPKKYIRHWPKHLKNLEPNFPYRGVKGQRDGLYPMLMFVKLTVDHLLSNILSALTNPQYTSLVPEMYPRLNRIMVTYPLTWRKSDKEVFKRIIKDSAEKLLAWDDELKDRFDVELICSEPVAVASYLIWETIFQYGVHAIDLIKSSLGNTKGSSDLRLLIVDIGGGSTDVALVEINWESRIEDWSVDVKFKLLESMRFNRAGDRISHLIVTAIFEFIKNKYQIAETLDFKSENMNGAFTRVYKQEVISKLSEIAEQAKVSLSETGKWMLIDTDERSLVEQGFAPLVQGVNIEEKVQTTPHFILSLDILLEWIQEDKQSIKTKGEPGFMDIFFYLRELKGSLTYREKLPDLVVLSGRTTRFSIIKDLAVRYLDIPYHRIKTLQELLPITIEKEGHENPDKISVVCGAQRFWFGDNVRFIPLPDEPIFNRFIGTVMETPEGLKLNKVFIEPRSTYPRTIELEVFPTSVLRIGHAFRREGIAEVIAELTNSSHENKRVKVDIEDDYTVTLKDKNIGVFLDEWVPGGKNLIVDNFNDTGQIDNEPAGFLTDIIKKNIEKWQQ